MFPNLITFYVDDLSRSKAFYEKVLRNPPVESFPDFAWFDLGRDFGLAIWTKTSVKPEIEKPGIGGELTFSAMDRQEVEDIHANWSKAGARIIQEPSERPFGYTFTAVDPDGNRLRVFCPPEKE